MPEPTEPLTADAVFERGGFKPDQRPLLASLIEEARAEGRREAREQALTEMAIYSGLAEQVREAENVADQFKRQAEVERAGCLAAEARLREVEAELADRTAERNAEAQVATTWLHKAQAAEAQVREYRAALKKLNTEVKGLLGIAMTEIREAVGSTNVGVVQLRSAEAEALLARTAEGVD